LYTLDAVILRRSRRISCFKKRWDPSLSFRM